MKKSFIIFCSLLLISACSNAKVQTTTPPTIIPTSSFQPTNTSQHTPTYLAITPSLLGTKLPQHGNYITVESIDHLTLLSRWGNGNPSDVVYSPDGKFFVIGTSTGLYIYRPGDYSLINYIDTKAAVIDVTISQDSQTVAAAVSGEVLLYQIPDWQSISFIKVDANSVDLSSDGKMMALGINSDPDYLQLRDVLTGEVIKTSKNEQAAWAVKISPRGNVIATGGYSTTIWSLDGSILDQHGPYVSGGHTASVSFSPDGNFLAEGSEIFLRIWRVLENGKIIKVRDIEHDQFNLASIINVAISPNGKMVAATLQSGIGVWDLATGQCVFYNTVDDGMAFYNSLAWSTDNNTIATASNKTGVEIWHLNTGENLITLNTPSGSFSSLVWSPDGKKLGAGTNEGVTYIFDAKNGILFIDIHSKYEINSMAFAPDSNTLALGHGNQTAQIWTIDGTLQQTIEGFGYGSSDVTFSSDGTLFAGILPESWQTPTQVRFWSTRNWEVVKIFPVGDRDNYLITGFELAPNQKTGAISFGDLHYNKDLIKIISMQDGTTISTLEPKRTEHRVAIDTMEYSPDNSLFAALVSEFGHQNPRIFVWQTSDWSLLYQMTINAGSHLGLSKNQQDTLTWSPDCRMLAVGVKDGSIQILRADNGENLTALNGHTMQVTGVSFSPDGRILASISLDGTLMLWGLR